MGGGVVHSSVPLQPGGPSSGPPGGPAQAQSMVGLRSGAMSASSPWGDAGGAEATENVPRCVCVCVCVCVLGVRVWCVCVPLQPGGPSSSGPPGGPAQARSMVGLRSGAMSASSPVGDAGGAEATENVPRCVWVRVWVRCAHTHFRSLLWAQPIFRTLL